MAKKTKGPRPSPKTKSPKSTSLKSLKKLFKKKGKDKDDESFDDEDDRCRLEIHPIWKEMGGGGGIDGGRIGDGMDAADSTEEVTNKNDNKCSWTTEYNLIYYSNGHQFLGAVPSRSDSDNNSEDDCPIITVDAAPAKYLTNPQDREQDTAVGATDDPMKLFKTLTVVDRDDFSNYKVLDLNHRVSLREFYLAVTAARTSYSATPAETAETSTVDDVMNIENQNLEYSYSYDLLSNNCALFILDTFAYLEVPYKEKAMKRDIVEYTSNALMENDVLKDQILGRVSTTKQEGGTVVGRVWRKLMNSSEKAIMERVVESIIDSHNG